jgi:murein DD-endopeptidase MepM/ murein hydrolase activator NlpD
MSWIFPFPDSKITDHYGTLSEYRRKRKMQAHSGTDYAPGAGRAIPAIADGTIKLIQWSNILGWVVVYSVKDLKGETWFIGYSHLSCHEHGIDCKGPKVEGCSTPFKTLKLNQKLKVGAVAGRVGNSGTASSGAHVHITASKTLKGVFGVTSDKVDVYKLIKANQTPAVSKSEPVKKHCATCACK